MVSHLLVAGKLVLLAPNQVAPVPQSMLINLPVPMATSQLVLASQAPVTQVVTTTVGNQGQVASVQNNTVANSVGMPLQTKIVLTCAGSTVAGTSVGNNADNKTATTTSTAVSSALQMSSVVTGVLSTALPTSLTTVVSSTSPLTSTSFAVPVLSQQSSKNTQTFSAPAVVVQPGLPLGVNASKKVAVTSSAANKPCNSVTNISLGNISAAQNNMASAVPLGQEQLSTVLQPSSMNESHVKASTNQRNSLSNPSLPFSSTVSTNPLQTPVTLSTQATHPGSSSVLSTINNNPWSTALQTCAGSIISSQGQAVQSAATLQSTNVFPSDSTSTPASSSFLLTDSVASNAAPLDTDLEICRMSEDATAPSLMSPRSLQAMLQSMLSTSDAQLLWNTMLNSSIMPSPIFKLADTSNSTATVTCTAADSFPRTSPLEQGSEQFASQQSGFIAQETEALQENNEIIPESIQDAFNDLNVQGVTDQERLAEEVIFSSMLSSKAKGTGSGYGLGIDLEELLEKAGIVQDPVLHNL